jgi:hypothetical protein
LGKIFLTFKIQIIQHVNNKELFICQTTYEISYQKLQTRLSVLINSVTQKYST